MVRLVHTIPGRSRFRLNALKDPRCDYRYIRGYLEGMAGVRAVRINPEARSVVVSFDPDILDNDILLAAVENLDAQVLPKVIDARTLAPDRDMVPLLLGGLLILGVRRLPRPIAYAATISHIANTVRNGANTALTEGLKVEVLDAVAVSLSAARGDLLTANITQWLLNLAAIVENSTRRASDDLVMRLLRPDVESAWIELPDGAGEIEIPARDLEVGMRVRVQAGDTVPVDGTVISGLATVNQSSVTGESLPIPREEGDAVLSGSILEEGRLLIRAEHVGESTTTARISRFLRDALAEETATQTKAQELADKRISITLGLGLGVFLLTRSLRRMESVFLVDFACASKLGASVAIKSSMAKAAERGALVKGGQALEKLARADTIVFDKTGTLTHNKLEVTDVVCLNRTCETQEALLALVASIAEHSSHPVAAAVVTSARSQGLRHMGHEEVAFMVGHGLAATAGNRSVRIGSRHFLEAHEAIDFAPYQDTLARLIGSGASLLYVGVDEKPFGVIALRDRIREEAEATITRLRQSGIGHVVLISGDSEQCVRNVGTRLGIDEVHAEIAPEDKASIIERLRAEGRNVAYVGDGVNDAPALMAADVGLAMPLSADVARATADIVLTNDALDSVADARDLSLSTLDLIDSNFKIAVAVNGTLLLGAAMGRVPPVASAMFHNGTTLAILARSLRGTPLSR